MDREQLTAKLDAFQKNCAIKGHPIKDLALEEAYPGVSGSSYIVRFSADGAWFEESKQSCAEILLMLVDVLWESTDEQTRKSIFTISINDVKEQPKFEQAA